jgi:hypothetical protein
MIIKQQLDVFNLLKLRIQKGIMWTCFLLTMASYGLIQAEILISKIDSGSKSIKPHFSFLEVDMNIICPYSAQEQRQFINIKSGGG